MLYTSNEFQHVAFSILILIKIQTELICLYLIYVISQLPRFQSWLQSIRHLNLCI